MNILPEEKQLEALLSQRHFEPASEDFAQRIITASLQVQQKRQVTLAGWLQRIFAEFSLPSPAYALALTLMIGLVLGVSMPDDTVASPIQDVLSLDDEGGL